MLSRPTQAKKAIWDGRDRNGFPFLGHFPHEIIKGRHEQELKLTLVNGSIVQFVGTDNINALMSTLQTVPLLTFDYFPPSREADHEHFRKTQANCATRTNH
jgi:hypothetical protein